MTAAEIQKRYREKRKLNPKRQASYDEKHKIRNQRRVFKKKEDVSHRSELSQFKRGSSHRLQGQTTLKTIERKPKNRNRTTTMRENTKLLKEVEDLQQRLLNEKKRGDRLRKITTFLLVYSQLAN